MATKIVSTDVAGNVKPSFASSSLVGLTVRANGEEATKVLDMNGNIVEAQFPSPTTAPTLTADTEYREDQTYLNIVTPDKDTYTDGKTFGGTSHQLESLTANFQPSDVGKNVEMQPYTIPMPITVRNSSTRVELGTYIFPLVTNRTFSILGRDSKKIQSPVPLFVSSDVGLSVTLDGVAGAIAAVESPLKATLNVASAPGTGKVLVILQRAIQTTQWVAYAYIYAATNRYPLVENDVSIGGSLAPRGMPSPIATVQVYEGAYEVTVSNMLAPPASRSDLDQIWLFRTTTFSTEEEARTNAEAGNLFFVTAIDTVAGGPPVSYVDTNEVIGGDQIEIDNFGVPTFRYVIYIDPYWWGWGNMPLSIDGSWTTGGIITITDGTKWFNGRDGHYVKLEGVETGGIGDNGLWLFKWLTATTAQLTLTDGTVATVATAGTGKIVVQGPPTTLYRSKPRNPFSWGFTEYLASGARVPQIYAFKIGGGLGTAIAQVPNVPYLLVCTEYPASMHTLDLRSVNTAIFNSTLRKISNFYSVTSHFSQFAATNNGNVVLWGWDAKNYAIIQCDGFSVNVVSGPVSKTLRQLTRDRSRQQLAHGAYDARNRVNCMWLPSISSQSQVDLLVMNHAPTQQWFVHDDHDVLCSAQFQDGDTNLSKIYVGTETGLMGEAFADGFFADWVSSGRSLGTCDVATGKAITRSDGLEFYMDRDGYVGNWCLVTDLNGENEHWCRIVTVTATTLTFDLIRTPDGVYVENMTLPIATNAIFYVGLIECRMRKYFNMGLPAEDKKLSEIWLTVTGTTSTPMTGHIGSTFLRYFRDRQPNPFAPETTNGLTGVTLQRVKMDDTAETEVWFTQTPPTERIKTFGIEIIDRGLLQWRLFDWSLKVNN